MFGGMKRRKNSYSGSSSGTGIGSSLWRGVLSARLAWMLTTDGPSRSTSRVKSGSSMATWPFACAGMATVETGFSSLNRPSILPQPPRAAAMAATMSSLVYGFTSVFLLMVYFADEVLSQNFNWQGTIIAVLPDIRRGPR
ncbi:hypothetical protein D3C72_1578960 [compost metagenome]